MPCSIDCFFVRKGQKTKKKKKRRGEEEMERRERNGSRKGQSEEREKEKRSTRKQKIEKIKKNRDADGWSSSSHEYRQGLDTVTRLKDPLPPPPASKPSLLHIEDREAR